MRETGKPSSTASLPAAPLQGPWILNLTPWILNLTPWIRFLQIFASRIWV